MPPLSDAGWFDVGRNPSGTELIAGIGLPNPFLSTADGNFALLRHEGVQVIANPSRFYKVADDVSAAGQFPADGGTTPSQGSLATNEIKLHSSAAAQVGLVLGKWKSDLSAFEWGLVTAWDSGTKVAGIHRAWTTAPTSGGGDTTLLLLPCYRSSYAYIKGEFSSGVATAELVAVFFDVGLTAAVGTRRVPIAFADEQRTLRAYGSQYKVEETSHYHSGVLPINSFGGIGYKIDLLSITAGTLSLWGSPS